MIAQKKILSFMLALMMLCGLIPPITFTAVNAADTAVGAHILNAAYTDQEIVVNGITDPGLSFSTNITDTALVGALWNMESLYLMIRNQDKERLVVTVNGVKLTSENAEIKSSTNKVQSEYAVRFETLGIHLLHQLQS